MPVFDGKNFSRLDEGEAVLAAILHATPAARDTARERGRLRLERATMAAQPTPPREARMLTAVDVNPSA